MSTTITDRAALVLQQIDAALEMAEKATRGPWIAEDSWVGKGNSAVATTCHYAHDADAAFIATSRTLLPTSLRCLKTAIEGLLKMMEPNLHTCPNCIREFTETITHLSDLTTLCDQWEASR